MRKRSSGLPGSHQRPARTPTTRPVRAAKSPVTLAAIKADKRFAASPLVVQGRLSVVPVAPELDKVIRTLAGL
jgi:predicted RNA-binding protein with PUA-like domain